MELDKIPQWMLALEEEDAAFLKNFLMKSGSLERHCKAVWRLLSHRTFAAG